MKPLPWADFWSIYCWTQVSGDQGMLQQRIHSWLGGVQERRNASGYVHFCAPMDRALGVAGSGPVKPVWGRWNVCPFLGGTGSQVFWGYSIDVWICIKISQPSNLYLYTSVFGPQFAKGFYWKRPGHGRWSISCRTWMLPQLGQLYTGPMLPEWQPLRSFAEWQTETLYLVVYAV